MGSGNSPLATTAAPSITALTTLAITITGMRKRIAAQI
jgi:hypothetical protein